MSLNMPVQQVVKGANLERFASARAILLVKPSDAFSVTTTLMYQRIDADGYNNFQDPPGSHYLAIYQPYDQQEPYYDSFKMASVKLEYNFGPATLTSATSYWKRFVEQSTDSTEALQNINDLTHLVNGVYVPNFIQNLYVEDRPDHAVRRGAAPDLERRRAPCNGWAAFISRISTPGTSPTTKSPASQPH